MALTSISVYLIVYNDYDHLAAALSSVAEFADEIVVVDGAYEWLSPLIALLGLPLERSCDECTDVLHSSTYASKIRYFSGIWKTESHKRAFAYERCSKDLVYFSTRMSYTRWMTLHSTTLSIRSPGF
jgi:hypothetical protein